MATPRLGAPELSTSQISKEATINEAFHWFDASGMGGFTAIDRDLDTPPGSPSPGDCYILPASPTGAWSIGNEDDIALFLGTAWEFRTPTDGWEAWVIDEAVKVGFSSGSWGIIGTFDGGNYIPLTYLDTDDTLAADSDAKVPSQKAVKAYVDGAIGATGPVASPVATISGTTYDLLDTDEGKYLRCTNASAKTVTVRDESDHALPDDGEWHFRNVGAGDLTFVEDTAVTINPPAGGSLVVDQGGTVTLKRVAEDEFDLIGVTAP